jgi:hypothetical protein
MSEDYSAPIPIPLVGEARHDCYPTLIVDNGVSLRDWFAGQALCGLLSKDLPHEPVELSLKAYDFADAMIYIRSKDNRND